MKFKVKIVSKTLGGVINFLEGMKSAMEYNLGVFLVLEIVIDARFSIERGGWFLIGVENEV